MRLYANENFPLQTVLVLRTLGYDILTTHDAGKSNIQIPDPEVLEFAIAENRAVITLNRKDFMKLHKLSDQHCGIIVCTKNDDFQSFAEDIHRTLSAIGESLEQQLIRVYRS
jgi:predicted nuclease of predicted toxin-antitoxin system